VLWTDVEAIYAFSRMDTPDGLRHIEKNWKVEAISLDGTVLWTNDFPTGSGHKPAIYNRDARPPPPPASPPPQPPAVQQLNTPCE
jgi:hypothetical protein